MTGPPWTSPPWLGFIVIALFVVLLLLIAYGLYKLWKLRHRLEALCWAMEEDREVATGILKTIKGWVVVNVEKEKTRVQEVKKLLEPIPEAAAQKVMEKLDEQKQSNGGISHDSGMIPIVKPPEGEAP